MERIDVHEARRLVEEDGALLIDCREGYEWDELRIPGATLVPLSEYEGNPELVEAAEQVVFYCAGGHRSQSAADIFEGARPGCRAFSVDGGIAEWAASSLPTEFGPPQG